MVALPTAAALAPGGLLALAVQWCPHGASFLWEDIAATGLGETD